MKYLKKIAWAIGVFTLISLLPSSAYAMHLVDVDDDPVASGSWTLNRGWGGISGFDGHYFSWDQQIIKVNPGGNLFEDPGVSNLNPSSWEVDYWTPTEVSFSGPSLEWNESLLYSMHGDDAPSYPLAYFDHTHLSYHDGILQEWGRFVGVWSWTALSWVGQPQMVYYDPNDYIDPIPEPGSMLLLGIGIIGLLGAAKFRKHE